MLLRSGRLLVPPGADPVVFILSDGKQTDASQPRLLTLAELFGAYQQQRLAGAKEASTIKTEDIHLRHLTRILKGRSFAVAVTQSQLQQYVATRLSEVRAGGTPITVETVRKEVATLRVVWNWAVRQEMLHGPAPVAGLTYPKRDEKPPFMTIDVITERCGDSDFVGSAAKRHWECLYLRRHEVQEVLALIREHSVHPYMFPLCALIAYTGVRLSETVRARREDLDWMRGTILVREKKRSRVRAITFRRVDLIPPLQDVLRNWLSRPAASHHLFTRPWDARRLAAPGPAKALDPDMAREHLHAALRGTRWEALRGFHVFRHSFASNLASQGVDQRIIDAWMGHQTEEMRQRYRHLAPETMREAILKLLPDPPAAH